MKPVDVLRYVELAILFIGIPLTYLFDIVPGHKSMLLLVVFVIMLTYLLKSKSFNNKELGLNSFMGWKMMSLRLAIAAVIILITTYAFLPDYLFYLPKHNPFLWLMIMLFYPLWSAFTQELIYRSFFFHRYSMLFKNSKVKSVVNGILFGFLHIIFANWIAVLGATLIGIVWAFSYAKHRSLLAIAIEHAIVGNLLYTIGLGQLFYTPDF